MFRLATFGIVLGCLTALLSGAGLALPSPQEKPVQGGAARPAQADPAEEPLPPQARVRLGSLRLRLRQRPGCLTFSPDGKFLVTAENEAGRVQFWDVRTGSLTRELPLNTGTTVAFSPDGKQFLTGHPYGEMHLWDTATGEKRRKLFVRAGHSMAFSPDGKSVLTTLWVNDAPRQQSAIVLFDLASGKELRRFPGFEKQPEVYLTLAWSPDGGLIAAGDFSGPGGGDAKVVVWDAASARERYRLVEPYNVNRLVFSADSKSLVVGGANRVRVVEAVTGKLLRHFRERITFRGVALDGAGKLLLTASDKAVWDLASGGLHKRLPDEVGEAGWAAAFSPDGKCAAVSFLEPPFLALWDVARAEQIRFGRGHLLPVEGVAVADDGRRFATASGREVCLWAADGKYLRGLPRNSPYRFRLDGFRFAPDGTTVTAAGYRWDVATGKRAGRKHAEGSVLANDYLLSRAFFTLDGALLAIPSADETSVAVWDATAGKRLHTVAVPDLKQMIVTHAAFAPDGKTLATACIQNRGAEPATHSDSLVLWDARSGARRLGLRPKRQYIDRLLFFPDGEQLVASTRGGVLEIWHLPTATLRQQLTVPLDPRQYELTAFTLAPHGQLLATQARDAILLYETTSGQLVHSLGGFNTPVKSLAFGSDGRLLLSGHEDGTALVWDLLAGGKAGGHPRGDDGEVWQKLAGKPDQAYRVLWALAGRPDRAVSLLKKRLAPAPAVDEAAVKQWIADLGDARFARRDQASKQLRKLGLATVPALRQALKRPLPLETRRRLESVLAAVDPKVPPAELLRELRAVQLLELLGTPQSRAFLGELAGGHGAHPTTQAARAARARLEKR
jgi:WD40 repeat protein